VDVRPLRKDGREEPIRWWDAEYDLEATRKLIDMFRTFASVIKVFFNGPDIPFVGRLTAHDDHFHVELRG
jgi:hypothetical protein